MRKPTTPQLILLAHAHRNGGRLPSPSFAYYGKYAPYGGAEQIQAALAGAAKIRNNDDAERYLCDNLNRMQISMAGGFLDVERSTTDGAGDLAERYVAAIRNGRVEAGVGADGQPTYISPVTLRACIRAGWLDEKWRLTEHGYAAGRAADHDAFRPPYDDGDLTPERLAADEAEARRIHHALYGLPGDPDPDEVPVPPLAHTDARREPWPWRMTGAGKSNLMPVILAELAERGAPHAVVTVEEMRAALAPETTARARALLTTLMAGSHSDQLIIMDPKRLDPSALEAATVAAPATTQKATVAAAMTGRKPQQLTAAETAAQDRGVNPATFRRLHPAVTGDLVDELLTFLARARAMLARELTQLGREQLARTIAGDVREAGYRVALHEIRTEVVLPERVRTAAFNLELALTAIRQGSRRIANRCIDNATRALS